MENMEQTGSAEATNQEGAVVESQTGVEGATPDTSTGVEQTQPIGSESSEQAEEFVKDADGNEYIPRKAFEARLAKLSEQKHNAQASFLETLRNDPVAKQQFMEELKNMGVSPAQTSSPQPSQPSKFEQWIAPLPPEHQAHYKGMYEGIMDSVNQSVTEMIKSAVTPILSFVGGEKVKSFSQMNKDFGKYQETVYNLMQSGRATNLEDAYKLASYEDKIKGASVSKPAPTQRPPIQGGQRSPMGVKTKGPSGLRAALEKAAQETGYVQE